MGKARYLADLLGGAGDIKSTRFDSMPAIDWNSRVINKPTLFSGSYTNLTNKPTILSIGTTATTAMAGNTPILQVETVASLPASPVAGTLYLVTT